MPTKESKDNELTPIECKFNRNLYRLLSLLH